jgi:AAA ATPase domain
MPQSAGPHDAEAFVGRSRELTVLSAALRQATTGDARLALISGEPGIGKTELARAFARAAAASGALVLWGSAWEEGGAPPYWPWVQVLRSYARPGRRRSPPRPVRRRPCWPSSCPSSALPLVQPAPCSPDPEMRPG